MKRLLSAVALFAMTAVAAESPVSSAAAMRVVTWQWFPSMAVNGDRYLIDWSDSRASLPSESWPGVRTTMAMQLDSDGTTTGLLLPQGGAVVPFRDGFVTTDGALVDGGAVRPLSLLPVGPCAPAQTVSDGSRMFNLCMWSGTLTANVYDETLALTASTTLPAYADHAAIAVLQSGFAIAYAKGTAVHAAFFDRSGREINDVVLPLSLPSIDALAATSDGSQLFVVCESTPGTYAAALVDGKGATRKVIAINNDADAMPAVAHSGSSWVLAYARRTVLPNVSAMTVDDAGNVSGPIRLFDADGVAPPTNVQIAAGRTTLTVLATDTQVVPGTNVSRSHVHGALLRSLVPPDVVTPIDLAVAAPSQDSPSAATAANASLVVWREQITTDGMREIRAARVAADGTLIDRTPIEISRFVTDDTKPVVGASGSQFLVVWPTPSDSEPIHAMRIADDGTLLDPQPFVIDDFPYLPIAIVGGRTDYLMIGAEAAHFVSTDGVPGLFVPIPFDYDRFDRSGRPMAATNGDLFVIVWSEIAGPYGTDRTTAGTIISRGSPYGRRLVLADGVPRGLQWNGHEFVLLTTDSAGRWYATTVSSSGDVAPASLAGTTAAAFPPATVLSKPLFRFGCAATCIAANTAADGSLFTSSLAEQDGGFYATPPLRQLFGPIIDEPTQMTDPFDAYPAIFGAGTPLVAYQRLAPELGGVWRVFVRPLTFPPHRAAAH